MKSSLLSPRTLVLLGLFSLFGLRPAPGVAQQQAYEVGGVKFTMVQVEGGSYNMGATPEQQKPYHDEYPCHPVTVGDFQIATTEVTQALWMAVMGKNPSEHVGPQLPVERVSWNDCQLFLQRLDSITGLPFRLPTEAEWEYAARGGRLSRQTQYAGSDSLSLVAWYYNNSGQAFLTTSWSFQDQLDNHCSTHDVGTTKPNELGLYDMSGNVWEWCQDWYFTYSAEPQVNPRGPLEGIRRVARGGSWAHADRYCRLARRQSYNPAINLNINGLRLAL